MTTDFTVEELDEAIASEDISWHEVGDCWGDHLSTIEGIEGHFKTVAEWSHGDGHEMGKVIQHLPSNRFFRKTGVYSSWDGSDYDSVTQEVKEVKVVVQRFQKIDSDEIYEEPVL